MNLLRKIVKFIRETRPDSDTAMVTILGPTDHGTIAIARNALEGAGIRCTTGPSPWQTLHGTSRPMELDTLQVMQKDTEEALGVLKGVPPRDDGDKSGG